MKARVANCPACGGPVEFHVSTSLVTVCGFCNSAVARADKALEDLGKVADLVRTDSPLSIGLHGRYKRKGFDIMGRVQYRHAAGGVWNEWYALFANGRWGWIAEAQGKVYLTFQRKLAESFELPGYDGLEVGSSYALGGSDRFTVVEKGMAEAIAAEGEIPWTFHPGEIMQFADLHGPNGGFATFDYEEDVTHVYTGREVTLEELDLPVEPESTGMFTADTSAIQLNCPHCGGPLELRAPDRTERVACPSCSSLLDTREGKLEYLSTLKCKRVKPLIPLGSSGKVRGTEYTVIGFMERFATWAGKVYPWTEYLLCDKQMSFRWLVHSEGHWTFAEPVSAGDMSAIAGLTERTWRFGPDTINYDDDSFRLFDRGTAKVRYVAGEFYWKVEIGEKVSTKDYIAPPRMLSFELTQGDSEELNVSMAHHLTHEELEKAFDVELWRPWSVGPVQPRPSRRQTFLLWPVFLGVLLVINILFSFTRKDGVDQWMFFYALLFVSALPLGVLLSNYSFEVNRWRDSDFSPYASSDE